MVGLHGLAQLQILGILHVEEAGAAPDHEDLADLFFERQLVQSLFRPLLAAALQAERPRVLVFIFCQGNRRTSENEQQSSEFVAHRRKR